jgi:hypothetical protein
VLDRLKVGTKEELRDADARGVVGGEGGFWLGFLKEGGGGGGIALRSSSSFMASCFVVMTSFDSVDPSLSTIATGAPHVFLPTSWRAGRLSHSRKDHEDGGCL